MTRRYSKSDAPLIALKSAPEYRGRLLEEGDEQSVVCWNNGNETTVVNDWIIRVKDDKLPKQVGVTTGHMVNPAPNFEEVPKVEKPVKIRREPDELALRVAKFEDAGLKTFAQLNGVWDDKYAMLPNPGLRRMNVLNRLRAKMKREPDYKVKWS